MGCDIHVHTEIKIDGKWEHYSNPHVQRWYKLFMKMAGVRDYVGSGMVPISEPKGVPSDITVVTRIDYEDWAGDAHSTSWFGLNEIRELSLWFKEESSYLENHFGYLFGNQWESFPDEEEENGYFFPQEVEDVRFIFWFDN